MDYAELHRLAEEIEAECGKVIIGKQEQIRLVLTSLFAGGHVLIDDIPGVGKTTLVKALSWAVRWSAYSLPRISCPQTSSA